jgi:hypothetical protein
VVNSAATGINNNGEVVGYFTDPSGTLQVIGFQIGLPLASASLLIPQAIENTGGLSHDDAPPGLDSFLSFGMT